ncbi:hypothetical protein [Rhodococcus aerolatus]
MLMSEERWRSIQEHRVAKTGSGSGRAPTVVVRALLTLAAPDVDDIRASTLAEHLSADEVTTWRAAWLMPDALVYVEASEHCPGMEWASSPASETCKAMTSWRRPLVSIDHVELDGVPFSGDQHWDQGFDRPWRFDARVIFRDGYELRLPLAQATQQGFDEEREERFWDELNKAWTP